MNDKNKYEVFFEQIKKFKEEQQKQKQRGLNDFNLLSTVRKYHDEVYLHSTMIGALLDPKGLHYQDTLFLEKFFDILKLSDFDLDLRNTTIGVEYKDIDLYITDGTKHIIIENKICAEDQPCQIIKYINIIKEENDLAVHDIGSDGEPPKIDDIYTVYLTPNNKEVSYEHKVENNYISFSGSDDKLKECSERSNTKNLIQKGLKNYRVKYKKINYKDDILNWLNMCIKEVENITNLNEAIKQYIDVVKMVNNDYKGKIKTMENEILLKDDNLKLVIQEVIPAVIESKRQIQKRFWEELRGKLKDKTYDFEYVNDKFEIQTNLDEYINSDKKYYGLKYDILEIDTNHKLHFYIEQENNITYGFTISENGIRKEMSLNFDNYKNQIEHICDWTTKHKYKNNPWWLHWNYPKTKLNFKDFSSDDIFNLVDDIYSKGTNNIIENLANEIVKVIEEYKKL